jgi:hypothetical protein
MLHGNEPSGLRAIHRALRAPAAPQVDTVFFIGAVEAAKAEPRYRHRMLPGRMDLNRCFGRPGTEKDRLLAARALELLTSRPLEACVDLHNNSGHNPAYTVALSASPRHQQLGALFADTFVHAEWKLGTLMEALGEHCPSVTIECGKAGESAADDIGWKGLRQFLSSNSLWTSPLPRLRVFTQPVRATLKPDTRVTFHATASEAARAGAGALAPRVLSIAQAIERKNFERLPPGVRLGWVHGSGDLPLEVRTAAGRDVSERLFEVKAGELVTKVALILMMITTVPEIAQSDCLFYAVRG